MADADLEIRHLHCEFHPPVFRLLLTGAARSLGLWGVP